MKQDLSIIIKEQNMKIPRILSEKVSINTTHASNSRTNFMLNEIKVDRAVNGTYATCHNQILYRPGFKNGYDLFPEPQASP